MSERDAEWFNDSYERCVRRPEFLERFYKLFIASSEEVAAKFANTDFKRQRTMLKESLYILMGISTGPTPMAIAHLESIAEMHSRRQLDIEPELYDLWLECLLQAVSACDPSFDKDIEAAWRHVLASGIHTMKSRY